MTENQKAKTYVDGILEAYHAHGYGMCGAVMQFISRDCGPGRLQDHRLQVCGQAQE